MGNLVLVLVWITYHLGGQDGSLYKETGLLPVVTNYVCVQLDWPNEFLCAMYQELRYVRWPHSKLCVNYSL